MINSTQNPKVRHARQLLRYAKARRENQQWVMETQASIMALIQQEPDQLAYLLYQHLSPELTQCIVPYQDRCYQVSESVFKEIPSIKTSPGVIAVVHAKQWDMASLIKTPFKGLYLDGVSKPGNMGSIIRSAAAFGMDGVWVGEGCVDPFHPDSIRGMAGHCFQVPIIFESLSCIQSQFPKMQYYELDCQGSDVITQTKWHPQSLIVLGSEQGAFRNAIPSQAHHRVRIPIHASVDSLNIASSVSICLYEMSRDSQKT